MMITVSGAGCCLVDVLYGNIDFSGESIQPFMSGERGDGGLLPGKLVFLEDFAAFAQIPFPEILNSITNGKMPEKINIGGPSIVPLIHLAQTSSQEDCTVKFYGRGGFDGNGSYLLAALEKTPVVLQDYQLVAGLTPSTIVMSDPEFDHGHGERIFVNTIGAANSFLPEYLDDDFFKSDIVVFGGTALVPTIHDQLHQLLKKSKDSGAITVVNTVFDFRNEKLNPYQKWPLGDADESYKFIDLLIADHEEALRLSGASDTDAACAFFIMSGLSAFIITNGSKDLCVWSDGKIFEPVELCQLPVSQQIVEDSQLSKSGDTTGCGDNFVGGVLFSMVEQLKAKKQFLDLLEASAWGVVSGGFACFYVGGTYHEAVAGDKLAKIKPYYELYKAQLRD
jgi:sugar/nucleoside kinase (ribokinase family)